MAVSLMSECRKTSLSADGRASSAYVFIKGITFVPIYVHTILVSSLPMKIVF